MSGGGGGGQTTSTTTQVNYSPEEAAARAKVQAQAEQLYNQTSGALSNSPYPGSAPVGFSDATQYGQNLLYNYGVGAGRNQAEQAGNFSQWLQGPAQYAESNPYLQSSMQAAIRPITQSYTDPGGVMSTIRTGSINNGAQGASTRQGIAEGLAVRNYQQTVADTTSKMASENYQNALKAGTQALALAPQTFQLGTAPATAIASVGQQQEMLRQAQEDYAANARMWALNAPWLPLQNYANIVYGGSNAGTTATSTGSGAQTNRFMTGLGGAAMGYSMAGSLASAGMAINPLVGAGIGLLAGLFG